MSRKLRRIIAGVVVAWFMLALVYVSRQNSFADKAQWDNALFKSLYSGHHDGQQQQLYDVVVDGIIFKLQGDNPKGISMVWLNLLKELPKQFPPPHRVIWLDHRPGGVISSMLASVPNLLRVNRKGSLEDDILAVLAPRRYDAQAPTSNASLPIVVFFSTYYTFPKMDGICSILMYHDLIPEQLGWNVGPGTEYYDRIVALPHVNGVVSVSKTTTREVLAKYGDHVRKRTIDEFYGADTDDDLLTRNTIMTTVLNRISRDAFPGPASPQQVLAFRHKFGIEAPEAPLYTVDGVPVDYLLTVGSAYNYKNTVPFMAAVDQLPDDLLEHISVVLAGRPAVTVAELAQFTRHHVHVNGRLRNGHISPSSPVIVRMYHPEYISNADLVAAYTGAVGLVYPSEYEGFGLPVAEALTSGTLVATSNQSSMPEVGGPAAFYISKPSDSVAIARAILEMTSLTAEQRVRRIEQGLKWVEQFGGGGPEGLKHGWNEMAAKIKAHITGHKNRGDVCYNGRWVAS